MRKKKNETVEEVTADFKRRREERRRFEAQWTLNINFYNGNQYAEATPDGELRNGAKKYAWQEREVYNHIATVIETRLAKFATLGAEVSVRPASGDFNDVNAAKFSTRLLRSVKEENDFKKLFDEAAFWSEMCGTSFYKVIWSPLKGRLVSRTDEKLYEGDVEISVCPPYEIYPDNLSAAGIGDLQSIIHAKAYPVERIEDIWGVKVEGAAVDVLTPDGIRGGSAEREKLSRESKSDYAIVIERYCRPDRKRPDGRLTIVAGDKLLYDGALPFANGTDGERTFPFIRQVCLEQPGSFFGSSIIERLIPPQRAYNAVKNRKHEFLNRMASGILMVEDGSIDVNEIEDEGLSPGKVVIYRQGSNVPIMMNTGGVPAEFSDEENRLLNEFVTISGVSDFLTSATIVSSNMSGVALNLIIEQDNNRLSVTTASLRTAAKEAGRHILRLYKQFAATGRLKRIAGDDGEMETACFSGSDITSDDLVFDVENESAGSSAYRIKMAEELIKLGILSDDEGKIDRKGKLKLLEIMGLGNWQNAKSGEEAHMRRASRENFEIEVRAPEIEDIDDHNIHIGTHTDFLVSEYGKLSAEAKERLNSHIREHKVYRRLVNDAENADENI